MEEDIKILEEIVDIYYDCAGNKEQDYDMRVDMGFMKKEAQAIENLIKGYREKEESEKYLYDAYQDAGKKMFEYAGQLKDSVPKTKIKEIFDRLNISDIEPWSTYKVNGQILFDLQELMEE